jgi:hypothetical protein
VWIKVLLVIVFIAIVASLASSLFFLVRDRGDSRRTVRALTWRIGLSLGLFLFIMLLVALDVIKPHGLSPAPRSPAAQSGDR